MECHRFEEILSDFLDQSLSVQDRTEIAAHLHVCRGCAELLEGVRSTMVDCQNVPIIDPGRPLLERILLRTSGRARTLTFREILDQYLLAPVFSLRFAMGVALATLFVVLSTNFILPGTSGFLAGFSPQSVLRTVDQNIQEVYASGLRIWDRSNELQAEAGFFKDRFLNQLGLFIEELDVPLEGGGPDSAEPGPGGETPDGKNGLAFPGAMKRQAIA